MMRCHTPAQTRLYERGYPYVVELVDGHKDDKKPEVSAANVFKSYWGNYHVKWPRLTAAAFVRSRLAPGAERSDGPVAEGEAKAVIDAQLAHPGRGSWWEAQYVVLLLEAFVGTEVVLEAIVAALETFPEKRWANAAGEDGTPSLLAFLTGILLLRSKHPAEFRARLEAIYARASKLGVAQGEHTIRGGIDLALHGNAGAARTLATSHWQYWHYYLMVDDAAVHIARLKNTAKSDWVPEPRILFLAGEDLLPLYTSPRALRQGKRLPNILHDFGMFEHDRIFELFVDMIGVKGAGVAPEEYFRENVEYARPKLERLSRANGVAAVKANAALAMLDAR